MKKSAGKFRTRCAAGWSPAHCPLDGECRYWSRIVERCMYEEWETRAHPHPLQAEREERGPGRTLFD
jgi:hypothetical protein